jgi:hypothetical protein
MPVHRVAAVGLAAGLAMAGGAEAQPPHFPSLGRPRELGLPPAQVMILGVFHFYNPNADYAQFRGIDVLTPERQREIEAVAEGLAAFAPTRIAVEQPPEAADCVVAEWYERNLVIFANLAAVAQPGERVLLIIGAGHTPILRDLVRVHPDMALVEAVDFLPAAGPQR